MGAIAIELMQKQSRKFLRAGLDHPNQLERLHEIDLCAHAISCALSAFASDAGPQNVQTDLPDGQHQPGGVVDERERRNPVS
jgi:hypothetical protein